MPDRHPVAWSVDSKIPDEVRALIALVRDLPAYPTVDHLESISDKILSAKKSAERLRAMLDNPPDGKHGIVWDKNGILWNQE